VPFRAAFECLWCGRPHAARGPDDLEGWAQLCPDCLGKAGDNEFLRFRLHRALADRARAADSPDDEDDWLLRRGRYARGPIHDAAWAAELDAVGRWLDALPIGGRIVELRAGTGWWSPLLAARGELNAYDARPAVLDRARDRLVAHGLRAHLHVREPTREPEGPPADAVVAAFLVGGVGPSDRATVSAAARAWLRPRGLLATIDATADLPAGRTVGELDGDGLRAALEGAGFEQVEVTETGRFFLLGRAGAA
jgi:SAM-dependent methyltransferase